MEKLSNVYLESLFIFKFGLQIIFFNYSRSYYLFHPVK